MTGVIKSNRCGTCRKRKVKCDEVKPVCGPCQKGQRCCEAPISKVKFVKPKGLSPRTVTQCMPRETTTREISPVLSPQPIQTPAEGLTAVLVETFNGSSIGLRLSSMANFIQEIPRRLGHSAVLDATIACLVHRRLFLLNDCYDAINKQQQLYLKAVNSLSLVINDPIEGYSDNTLCAVALLGEIELLGGGLTHLQGGSGYIMHAGGAARLIQFRGADRHREGFGKLLLAYRRGAIVADAVVRGDDCFLQHEPWADLSFDDLPSTTFGHVSEDMVGVLLALPTLLKELRQFRTLEAAIDCQTVLSRAQTLRRTLQQIGGLIDEAVNTAKDIFEVPGTLGDTQVPVVYEYKEKSLAYACALYWGISIVLETIINRLLPTNYPQAVGEAIVHRCDRARQQICMSFEYSLRFWPLGSMYMAGPLIMSFYGATYEQKDWITTALWKLSSHIPGSEVFWSRQALEVLSRLYVGEWSDVMTSNKSTK